ncbi:hypothetical protein ABE073_04165 [Lederbergia citrisecunda]|uniref:hypothetical protein n=1 Tax=Lederbergia citrisecunda TaxID=2833583 RepID=UPI003D2C78D3
MNKLTEKQFDSIIDRFTSKTIYPKASLMHPAKSEHYTVASNAHTILFLSNQLVGDSINPERFLTAEQGKQLLTLESRFIDNYKQSSNNLALDEELIESIISSLKQHKKELKTHKQAYTYISYDKSVNGLSFSTYALSNNSAEYKKQSLFRPASVSDDINDFSILINANYLIDALETQLITD